jgi:LacI family transcriptional regulator
MPALVDVCRRAGVGASTVSRVINGGRNVSEKTMATVLRAIEELGYEPSQAARSLKGGRTKTIGLIVPSVADPFFSTAAAAIQTVAGRHGCLVLLAASGNDPVKEREQMTTFIQRRIDGLILAPSAAADVAQSKRIGIPVVCFDRPIKDSIACVVGDNYAGAKMATEHLIERGYTRILCLGADPKLFTSQARLRGHRQAIRRAGLDYLAEVDVVGREGARSAMLKHMEAPGGIDAIFATKNAMTVYVYMILREMGVAIPGEVALVGYDDFELADALDPPITVVRQPDVQIATRAAELLFHQMETGDDSHPLIRMGVELIVRGSCGVAKRPAKTGRDGIDSKKSLAKAVRVSLDSVSQRKS